MNIWPRFSKINLKNKRMNSILNWCKNYIAPIFIFLFAKLNRLNRYSFLNNQILLGLILLFIIVSFSNIHFVPDYIDLFETIKRKEVFELIIGSLSSILGIIISIILIRFEIVKQKLGRQVNEHLFKNTWFKSLNTFLLCTIFWALFAYLFQNKLPSDIITTHAYITIYLFATSIILLFPATYHILTSSASLTIFQVEIKKLDDDFRKSLITSKNIYFTKYYPLFDIDENTPLDILKRLSRNFVIENDFNATKFLLIHSAIHLIKWIGVSKDRIITNGNERNFRLGTNFGNEKDRDTIGQKIDIVTSIWQSTISEAISNKNYEILNSIWNVLYDIHVHFAKNKMYVLYLESLDDFEEGFLNQLMENDLTSVLSNGVKYRSNVFKLHLKENCPDEKYLSNHFAFIYGGKRDDSLIHNVSENVEWEHISSFHKVGSIIQYAIYKDHLNLVSSSFFEIKSVIHDIKRIETLSQNQKGVVLFKIYSTFSFEYLSAVRSNFFKNQSFHLTDLFDGSDVGEYVEENAIYHKRILTIVSDFVIESNMKSASPYLNHINNMAVIGRFCSEKIKGDDRFLSTCFFVLDTLIHLKRAFEKLKIKSDVRYSQVFEAIESIKDWHLAKNKKPNPKLIESCDELLSEFKKKRLKKNPQAHIIEWR